ncbi:MAG: hypothetical protein CMH32_04055 [Micavibrio sp.]|nr:hypothetical protein [Micavibrio sp.]
MAKTTGTENLNDTPTTTNIDDFNLNDFISFSPVKKLDADQYSAEDIDGVTESIFGSGNLSYASLQAAQTDNILDSQSAVSKTFDLSNFDQTTASDIVSSNSAPAVDGLNIQSKSNGETGFNSNQSYQSEGVFSPGVISDGNFSNTALGSFGASQLSVDQGAFSSASNNLNLGSGFRSGRDGIDGSDGTNGNSGNNGDDGSDGTDGHDGNNGNNGNDGNNGNGGDGPYCDTGDGPLINIDIDTSIIGSDISVNLGDTIVFLQETLFDLTETISILNVGIDETVDVVTNILNQILTDGLGGLTDPVETLTNLTENVNTLIETVLDTVTNTTESLINSLNLDSLSDLQLLSIDIDANIKEVLGDTLDSLFESTELLQSLLDTVTDQIDEINLGDVTQIVDKTLDPVLDTLDNLDDTVTTLTDTVTDALDGIVSGIGLGDILPGDGDPNDTDVTVDLGIDALDSDVLDTVLDATLNPVEDLVGDVDLDLGLGLDLLGTDTDQSGEADTDISIQTNIDLIDDTLLGGGIEISLDPIEEIVGDIDLDLGLGADLLGDLAEGIVNDGEGGSGSGLLNDIGDLLEDTVEAVDDAIIDPILGDTLEDIGDVAEDVVNTVVNDVIGDIAENLGLDITSDISLLDNNDSNDDSGSLIDTVLGGDDGWTDNALSELGDAFSGGLSDGLGDLASCALPEPTGTLSEGLNILSDGNDGQSDGLLGGLLG